MATLSMGSLFPPELVKGMMNQVIGHSSLAKLSNQKPLAFTGEKMFTFTLDKEADIVAENGAKTPGGGSVGSITVMPIKFEYSMRTSDEFMKASTEYQMGIQEQFSS